MYAYNICVSCHIRSKLSVRTFYVTVWNIIVSLTHGSVTLCVFSNFLCVFNYNILKLVDALMFYTHTSLISLNNCCTYSPCTNSRKLKKKHGHINLKLILHFAAKWLTSKGIGHMKQSFGPQFSYNNQPNYKPHISL